MPPLGPGRDLAVNGPEVPGVATPPAVGDVVVLRWPAQDHHRPPQAGSPARAAVLVVERGGPSPRDLGPFEDWLFDDASPQEVALRVEALASRLRDRVREPSIEDGLLRHDGRWVALSDIQLPVAELLVERLDALVSLPEIMVVLDAAGATPTRASCRALLHRIGRRVETVGLRVTSVRGRGVVLSRRPGPVPEPRSAQL